LSSTGSRHPAFVVIAWLVSHVVVSDKVTVGSRVSPGSDLLHLVDAAPVVKAVLTQDQARTVSTGSSITVTMGENAYDGVLGDMEVDSEAHGFLADIKSADGGAICGQTCAADVPVRVDGSLATFTGVIVVTPVVAGVMVPASAVVTDASGQAMVELPDGTHTSVDVVITQDGQSIVTGVQAGDVVLVSPASVK
jgi:hypothetical protein